MSTTRALRDILPTLAVFGLLFARPSSSDDAPATAIATAAAAGGATVTLSSVGALVTASLLVRRDAAADDDVLEDGDRFELPRFLLAIPPGLVDGGKGAAAAGAGNAATSGGEELAEERRTPPATGAGTSGGGAAAVAPADAAGRPAVLIKYGAMTGRCIGFANVASAAGARALSPPLAPGDPLPAAAIAAGAGAVAPEARTLGAGSHEVARLRNPWPFSALAIASTE